MCPSRLSAPPWDSGQVTAGSVANDRVTKDKVINGKVILEVRKLAVIPMDEGSQSNSCL